MFGSLSSPAFAALHRRSGGLARCRTEAINRAMAGRCILQREVDAALAGREAMLLPTLPITAPRIGEANITIDGTPHPVRNLMLRQTQLFNVTGHPAVSLPTGGGENGLPVGLQVVGRHHETNPLMQTALAIELALSNPDAADNLLT